MKYLLYIFMFFLTSCANKVYVVKGEHEYMIPAVNTYILSTDLDQNRMDVRLIEGMRTDEN